MKTKDLNHPRKVGETVHYVPTGTGTQRVYGVGRCVAAIVNGVDAGPLEEAFLRVFNGERNEGEMVGRGGTVQGVEHSSEGHKGTYHTVDECPFPPQVEDD